MNNSYLSSLPDSPEFIDRAGAAVRGIGHDEFTVRLEGSESAPSRLALVIQSPTRRHSVAPQPLAGSESMLEILELAQSMMRVALGDDLDYRFQFHGSPIFARGVE